MHIEEIIQNITPPSARCRQLAQQRFDQLIKPVGSLALLEENTSRYCGILGSADKEGLAYPRPALLVFADSGHMARVEALLQGRDPLNVLARASQSQVHPLLVTSTTGAEAVNEGVALVQELKAEEGLGLLALSSLAPAADQLVYSAMVGAVLAAASLKLPLILDGLAALQAAQGAEALAPGVLAYCFASQASREEGCEELLRQLGLTPPLRLEVTRGSGCGAALAVTIFQAGIKVYKEMETFEEAGVHVEMKEYSHAEEERRRQEKA